MKLDDVAVPSRHSGTVRAIAAARIADSGVILSTISLDHRVADGVDDARFSVDLWTVLPDRGLLL